MRFYTWIRLQNSCSVRYDSLGERLGHIGPSGQRFELWIVNSALCTAEFLLSKLKYQKWNWVSYLFHRTIFPHIRRGTHLFGPVEK